MCLAFWFWVNRQKLEAKSYFIISSCKILGNPKQTGTLLFYVVILRENNFDSEQNEDLEQVDIGVSNFKLILNFSYAIAFEKWSNKWKLNQIMIRLVYSMIYR
jgi:myosin-crossreactive antigen